MTSSPKFFNAAAAMVLISIGAAGYWAVDRVLWHGGAAIPAAMAPVKETPPAAAPAPAFVTLTPELVARAGIETSPVRSGPVTHTWRSPGTVEPDSYTQTIVSALAGGTVTAVHAGLGDAVRQGQPLVELFTREFAEADHMARAAEVGLESARLRRERTEKLVAIGGVSRQELDDAKAEEARQEHALDEANSRLKLLGPVLAPASGVVTARGVNRGQNVQPGAELMTISDLSTVWVMAEVYERDLAAVRVGAEVRVTSRAYPGETFTGRVTYLDPQISPDTRTLKARIEISNKDRKLRFGMLVDVEFTAAAAPAALLIPRAAVQQVGDRAIVFVADPSKPGRFEARDVQLGVSSGDDVEVLSGVAAGEPVVTSGSFALKAEWERKRGG